MYKLPYFTEGDKDIVLQFMKQNPFVTLITNNEGESFATQIPVLIDKHEDGSISLRGHIMRKTDHSNALEANPNVLILFTGAHCYVSSSWYVERNVGSTWNYTTVQVKGKANILDAAGTKQILTDLTNQYEHGQKHPELVAHMPPDYIDQMAKAIIGFEIIIEDIYPIYKLSQNRSDISYKNIVQQLLKTGDADSKAIAAEMIERRKELF